MHFLNSGKPVIFCGQPKSSLAASFTPAQLCAMAWARSNFGGEDSPKILEATRKGSRLTIATTDQEVIEFTFQSEFDAARALKQLPAAEASVEDNNLEALNREMNFGYTPQLESPPVKTGRDFSPA